MIVEARESMEGCRVDRVVFEVPDPWLSPSQSNSCFWDLRQTSEIFYHGIYWICRYKIQISELRRITCQSKIPKVGFMRKQFSLRGWSGYLSKKLSVYIIVMSLEF